MNVKNKLYLFVEKIALLPTSNEIMGDIEQCDYRWWDERIIEARGLILDELNSDTQPTAQPTETCKYKRHPTAYKVIVNPHNDCMCDERRWWNEWRVYE